MWVGQNPSDKTVLLGSIPLPRLLSGRGLVMNPPSRNKVLQGIRYSMSIILVTIKNLFLGVRSCYSFIFASLWHFIKRRDSYFITNCDKSLLQNTLHILLQNATFITKCVGTVNTYY